MVNNIKEGTVPMGSPMTSDNNNEVVALMNL